MTIASRISAFLAVLVTACAWPMLTTTFEAPQPVGAEVLLLTGVVFAAFACAGRLDRETAPPLYIAAAPLAAVAAVFMPWPWSLGLIVLAAGIALVTFTRRMSVLKPAYAALAMFGVLLAVEALVLRPAHLAMGRFDHVPLLAEPVAWMLRLFGVDASALDNSVYVVMIRSTYRFPAGLEMVGFASAFAALIGALAMVYCIGAPGRRARAAGIVALAWLVYLPLRAVMSLILFTHLQLYVEYDAPTVRADVLYNPWWQLITLAPLAFAWAFLARFESPAGAPVRALSPRPARPALIALAAATFGAFLLVVSWAWFESGEPTEKKLIIDERHSGWETTTRPLTTQWYGKMSTYNMYSLADYYSYFYPLVRNDQPITDNLLRDAGVLVLKVPTVPYAESEADAIVRFVHRGGGLFVIGEHTNYVGSAVTLNPILTRLGAKLRADCVFNLADPVPFQEVWQRPALYYHPIVAHVPRFRFEVSTSVQPLSPRVDSVMAPGGFYRLDADYHMENYYPVPKRLSTMRTGAFTQLAAIEAGRGRVVIFTDSTTTSNFSAFYPGRPELFLGTVDWLSRTHGSGLWRWPLAIAGLGLMGWGLFILLGTRDGLGGAALAISGLVFGAVLALVLARMNVERSFPLPKPIEKRPPTVAFLREGCDYGLPLVNFTEKPQKSYDLFCVWSLRVRYFPQVRQTLADAAADPLLVIPNPSRPFAADELAAIDRRRKTGLATMIVLSPEAAENNTLAYRSVLKPFGLDFEKSAETTATPIIDAHGMPTGIVATSLVIRGGTPLRTEAGQPVAVELGGSPGKLIVIGYGDIFHDTGMGYSDMVLPDPQLGARFKDEFKLLQYLMPPEQFLPPAALAEVLKDTAWLRSGPTPTPAPVPAPK